MELIDFVERINEDRWDTWVCIEPKCGISYGEEEFHKIMNEILEFINSNEGKEFYNKNTGDKRYKYARYVCACGDDPQNKEHWIVGNNKIEFDEEC